jgi:prepilin-type processing-associated H-X9-DG protein
MVPRCSRVGVSLIEVLVCITVLGVLMALLLPALQHMRHAAALAECQNNLKQLGMALLGFQGEYRRFPQAYNEYWNLCQPTDQPGEPDFRPRQSWGMLILPFIEQEALQRTGLANYQQVAVRTFLCPADPSSLISVSSGGNFKYLGGRFGLTSYLAVEASLYLPGEGDSWLNIQLDGPRDGVVCRSCDTRATDITDGSSNTVMLGERPPSPAPDFDWGWWTWSAYDTALATFDVRLLPYGSACSGPATYGPGNSDNPCDVHHFWSLHEGGANWAYADGSVRFLTYSAHAILPLLAARNDGALFDDPAN